MQAQYEEHYHRVEADHYWFVARRQLVRDLVLAANANRSCRVLEIGSSAGLLMSQLHADGYTQVTGIDISSEAVALCRKAGLDAQVMDAQQLAFADSTFDVLTASDVLEHLQNESRALQEWKRVLKPGGWLIVFVPAFMFLWTEHDVANKHQKRYRLLELVRALEQTGFKVSRSSYWNVFLFLPVALLRVLKRAWRGGRLPQEAGTGDMFLPPNMVNVGLQKLLQAENSLFRRGLNWPVGVSAMALAQKPG